MKKLLVRCLIGGAVLVASTGVASAQGVAVEANGARAHERWGGELGIGYDFRVGPVTLRPLVGAFLYTGDNDRYYEDTFSNGDSRCRDSQTGQFARDELCSNTEVKPYGKVEATFNIPAIAEVGAGARFSDERVRPYGTAAFNLLPKLKVKGSAGDRYFSLGLMASF